MTRPGNGTGGPARGGGGDRGGDGEPRRVLVTGASSGLGAALAACWAAPERELILWGRDPERLRSTAAIVCAHGATAQTRALDLRDATAAVEAFRRSDDDAPVDLVVLAAGLGDMRPDDARTEDPALALEVATVNFGATVALATAAAERMSGRRCGRIVLIGSVAGFHALPFAPSYSGSKAGLAVFAEALRLGLRPHGVGVTLVSPGFIDTPMSRRLDCPKPLLLAADRAAVRIVEAVRRDRAHLILPWPFAVGRALDRLMPAPVRHAVLGRLRAAQTPRPGADPGSS